MIFLTRKITICSILKELNFLIKLGCLSKLRTYFIIKSSLKIFPILYFLKLFLTTLIVTFFDIILYFKILKVILSILLPNYSFYFFTYFRHLSTSIAIQCQMILFIHVKFITLLWPIFISLTQNICLKLINFMTKLI